MKRTLLLVSLLIVSQSAYAQRLQQVADSLKEIGLLMPALMNYGEVMMQNPSSEISYKIASTTALLWTSSMRDTSFYFLNIALQNDSSLDALANPEFLSLIDDPRWESIEEQQIQKYEASFGAIRNKDFAKELFRMIIRDQGFMYAGNIERRKYMKNGGYFSTPAIFPVLAMEEKNKWENERKLIKLLDSNGWPSSSEVTEYAAAGAALIINHSSYEMRKKYFPLLEKAYEKGEAQAIRYAKMKDRLLIEEGKEQLYGTQLSYGDGARTPLPIHEPEYVDQRRKEIGLGPLKTYLKERFDIEWDVKQKRR